MMKKLLIKRKFSTNIQNILNLNDWLTIAKDEKKKINELLTSSLYQNKNHPIYNFIFIYFFFNRNYLFQYSPGIDTYIEDIYDINDISNKINLTTQLTKIQLQDDNNNNKDNENNNKNIKGNYLYININDDKKTFSKKFIQNTLHTLKSIHSKPPSFWCYGLHEWAMLYHSNKTSSSSSSSSSITTPLQLNNSSKKRVDSTFQSLPLRVTQEQIAAIINPTQSNSNETTPRLLRCTHYDAIRFFTPSSLPLNGIKPMPTRATTDKFDQPGCIHVNMDLFKWAVKLFPLIPSSLLIDSLEIALIAREVDMRASPYDLKSYPDLGSQFNSDPICVETLQGRKEYQKLQEDIYHRSIPIRTKLIHYYQRVLDEIEKKENHESNNIVSDKDRNSEK